MGVHREFRTRDEIMWDMISDDEDIETIAQRLQMSPYAIEQRIKVVAGRIGKQAR